MSSITETSSSGSWGTADLDWDIPAEDSAPAAEAEVAYESTEVDAATPEPSSDPFGLPEHDEARTHALAAPVDFVDDGFSCRRDPDVEPDESPIRGGVTVHDGQGILSALQAAGVPKDNLRAAYGSLVSSGQLTSKDFDDGKPVVQPGRSFQLDSAQFTEANARLGGQLIGSENATRVAEEAEARRAEAARAAPPPPTIVAERPAVEQPAQTPLGRLREQVASSTLIMAEPLVYGAAKVASWFGADVNPQQVSDNMFGAAREMIVGEPLPAGSNKVSYAEAMSMPVSPIGISKYDTNNITYHDYRMDTKLCHRSESFCTIPNLSPLVDHSSAPKAGWSGFQPMEKGPQRLIGGHPIIHSSDYDTGHFSNRTEADHVFHSGSVESQLYWKGDDLHLKTVGYGYGATPLHTMANYGVGVTYFSLWQAAVKLDVQAIRTFHPR